MAAVKQVGSERRKLSEGMVQQIKNEVAATKQMTSTREAGLRDRKVRKSK